MSVNSFSTLKVPLYCTGVISTFCGPDYFMTTKISGYNNRDFLRADICKNKFLVDKVHHSCYFETVLINLFIWRIKFYFAVMISLFHSMTLTLAGISASLTSMSKASWSKTSSILLKVPFPAFYGIDI